MKPVAPRGRLPDLPPARMPPLVHHVHLAQRALDRSNGDADAALKTLARAFEVHPRRAVLERAALRRAHRLAIQAAASGTPDMMLDDADAEDASV